MLIEVEVNGASEYAPVKDNIVCNQDTAAFWSDHLFFELRGLVSSKPLESVQCTSSIFLRDV